MDMLKQLNKIAKELENNGKKYSVDEQSLIRFAANSIVATVNRNLVIKDYSYNEDD